MPGHFLRVWWVFALVILVVVTTGEPRRCAAVVPASRPAPEIPGEIGQQAYDDLTALYGEGHREPDLSGAIQKLNSADAAARSAAGQYVLALLRQSLADESNGRAEWRRLPFFGGGSESAAREFRKRAAAQFGEGAKTDEATDAALWLIDQDPLAENQAAGVKVLRRLRSPAAVKVYAKLLSPAHHNAEVVVGLLDEVAARKQVDLAEPINTLCGDYRKVVREAARKAASALGLPPPPPFQPEQAFTPWLEQELRAISSMVLTEIPPQAKWRRFTVTPKPANDGRRPARQEQAFELSAWLLAETKTDYQVLDLFAREQTLAKAQTKVAERTMTQDADYFLHVRAEDNKDDPFKHMDALSERGGFTGQFQPRFVSLPEALLAAWAMERGDKATAAAVLFPRLDEAADERWIRMVARDLLGWRYHDLMLQAFSYHRDYAAAGRYAQHLAKPLFEGYQYHERAKEVAGQLAARGDDFKTLTLPTAAKWEELAKTLTRQQQIVYLADRLRLLNCFQWGQPGGVNFDDPQSDRPRGTSVWVDGAAEAAKQQDKPIDVINPYGALRSMKLEVRDVPPLLPYLADENFTLTYSYWRDFHPGRTMYRVNELVASIVNGVAKHDLADMATYAALDANGKKQHLEQVAKWVLANAGKGRTELLLETLETTKEWRIFSPAAAELIRDKEKRAVPVLAKRLNDFPQQRGDVAELCYRLSAADFVEPARRWVKEADGGGGDKAVRFWGAIILMRAGDRGKLEGLDALKPILEQDDGSHYYPLAFDELLASDREEALKVACAVLPKLRRGPGDFEAAAMVHRLVLKGRPEALEYMTAALDSTEKAEASWGQYEGKEVQRQQVVGDSAASALARWRTDKYSYSTLAPDDARAAERAKLKAWLVEQVRLRREGKKSGLREEPDPLHGSRWQLDAP
jgi:hypothetical protein